MDAGGEKALVVESHQPLLGGGEELIAAAAVHGASTREWVTRGVLIAALLINFCTWRYFSSPSCEGLELRRQHGPKREDWAHSAAEVAENLATYDCSGHGTVFVDTLQTSANEVVCDCDQCFTGPSCAEYVPDCDAAVDSGDPVMYEAFWKQNADMGTTVTPPWYRISYGGVNPDTGATLALESQIRALHALAGNAVTQDKTLVIAAGSSSLLAAITQALCLEYPGKTSLVSLYPFYERYRRQAAINGNERCAWEGDAATFGSTVGKNVVEFVTSPNNPTFELRRPVLNGSQPIYDFAYYWPSMTHIDEAMDEDIMVFTFSKIGGHAGSRLGWAFFKDPELALKVRAVDSINSVAISHDTQNRAFEILRAINSAYSNDNGPVAMDLSPAHYAAQGRIFHYGRAVLQRRYQWLQGILARSSRFFLLQLDSEYCAFFGQMLPPSPAYAWVYCNRDEDEDCYNLFVSSGIITYPGVNYGATNRHVRFSLLKRDFDYQQLEKYLPALVAG